MTINAAWRAWILLGLHAACLAAARRHRASLSGLARGKLLTVDHDLGHGQNQTAGDLSFSAAGRKPPRIFRTGRSGSEDDDHATHISTHKCGETMKVDSSSDKYERCPTECPFYVSDKTDDRHCTFVCVTADKCSQYNPKASVPDEDLGACRAPMANYCKEYDHSGKDRCLVCKGGYYLWPEDGQCYFKHMWAVWALVAVLLTLVTLLALWLINLGNREITNEVGLQDGLQFRSACKLRNEADAERNQWPLSTNLMTTEVAGPGMLLHFNFQANLILWALGVAVVWCVIAYIEDPVWYRWPDLMRLGTRKMGLPRDNCILVAWGFETQQRLMWVKIYFLLGLYLVTFALALLHSVRQLRLFEALDAEESTMTDFAALLTGLPQFEGDEKAEEIIKKAVEEQTKEKVVGVSIAWNFKDDEDMVMNAVKDIVYQFDAQDKKTFRGETGNGAASSKDAVLGSTAAKQYTGIQKKVYDAELYLFGPDEEEENEAQAIVERINQMRSSEYAFVVFETEDARNSAVESLEQKGGLSIRGATAQIDDVRAEPDTVQWENFGHSSLTTMAKRLAIGFGLILLALLVWTVCFYGPYAWSISNFNYDNGQQPGFVYGFAFSMVVVVGNAIMYEVCARVSDMVGFHFRDNRESCYMILYTISCTFNILLDFVTTYWIVWEVSKGLGFRTYHGVKVQEIDTSTFSGFTEAFETYAMQRQLGENTYTYAFPSTFLIPFLIEPFITIYVPLKLGVLLVRAHPEIMGRHAEEWLAAAPMDMGRYADCLLNVVLAVLVLYFPGGWTWRLFFAMGFCHMFIYAFDHWKVLQNIPKCTYASMDVDWWSQAMLAPCTGVILSCTIFKANCQDYGYCIEGFPLVTMCSAGFWLHCFVHIGLLVYVVPMFKRKVVSSGSAEITFKDVATCTPCSWFNSNPVHCLRSMYKFGHSPPCKYFMVGKEHCLEVNEKANSYFHGIRVEAENYEESVGQVMKLSSTVRDAWLDLFKKTGEKSQATQGGENPADVANPSSTTDGEAAPGTMSENTKSKLKTALKKSRKK